MIINSKNILTPQYSNLAIMRAGRLEGNKRIIFIKAIAKYDLLLAAKCIGTSVKKQDDLNDFLAKESHLVAIDFDNQNNASNAFRALLEIQRFDLIVNVVKILDESLNDYTTKMSYYEFLPNTLNDIDLDLVFLLYDLLHGLSLKHIRLSSIFGTILIQRNGERDFYEINQQHIERVIN